jgi:hypothetical protein
LLLLLLSQRAFSERLHSCGGTWRRLLLLQAPKHWLNWIMQAGVTRICHFLYPGQKIEPPAHVATFSAELKEGRSATASGISKSSAVGSGRVTSGCNTTTAACWKRWKRWNMGHENEVYRRQKKTHNQTNQLEAAWDRVSAQEASSDNQT